MFDMPVGYRRFHPAETLNYQLNRWLALMDEAEIASAARRIGSMADWRAEMLALASVAARAGRDLHAASYFRAAEFFMAFSDPMKGEAYDLYRSHFARAVADVPHEAHEIPFQGAHLPAIRFAPEGARADTFIIHGGFDSYMEEFFFWGPLFAARGIETILIEGPGQGAALRRAHLKMGHDWGAVIAAALDHFNVSSATLIGLSLGGCLGLRAAAVEPRIARVVAWNMLYDFLACFTDKMAPDLAAAFTSLEGAALAALVEKVSGADESIAWALAHGMHISGAESAADYVGWLRAMTTRDVSDLVAQDVLILAGTQDHIVPLNQLAQQAAALTNARSVTTRLFTPREHAASHCQVGNIGLALEVILNWRSVLTERDAALAQAA